MNGLYNQGVGERVKTQRLCALGLDLTVTVGISEEVAATAWMLMKAKDLLWRVYPQGVPSIGWFIEWTQKPAHTIFGAYVQSLDAERSELVGLGWACEPWDVGGIFRKAEMGMCFFSDHATPAMRIDLADMMIDLTFENDVADVLFGTTPVPNRAAIAFAKKLGFEMSGPIPHYTLWKGRPAAVMVSTLSREDYDRVRTK